MLIAAAEVTAEKGYVAATVADVLKRARVSRLTFYEQFANKEECVNAAYDLFAGSMTERIGVALAGDADLMVRCDRAVATYLALLAKEPLVARFYLVESFASPALQERRLAKQRGLARLIAAEFEASTEGQKVACEAFVGAVAALVTSKMMAEGPEAVVDLHKHIMNLATAIAAALPSL